MSIRRCSALLMMFVICLSGRWARAQQQPRCEDDPKCITVADRAGVSSEAGKLDDAVTLYRAAYALRPDPLLLYNIARLLQRMGRLTEAAGPYERFLQSGITDEGLRSKAQEALAQIRAATASPQPIVPTAPPEGLRSSAQETLDQIRTATASPQALVSVSPQLPIKTSCPTDKPAYKKGWFWAVVGSVGAVAVAGVVVSIVLATRLPPAAEPGPEFRPFGP